MLGTGELDPPTENIVRGGKDSKQAVVNDIAVRREVSKELWLK